MALSKAELKTLYKQVVKEIIQEEKEVIAKKEQEKQDAYMEIINALTFHELLESEVDYENSNKETDDHFSLKLWSFPDDIHKHLQNKFEEPLKELNAQFEVLMNPVNSFIDEMRKKLVNKELDAYNLE